MSDLRFRLKPERHELELDGRTIRLSPLGSQLLEILVARTGELVKREELIDRLWGGNYLVGNPALSRLVSEVRSAVGDDASSPDFLQTIPRKGYRLIGNPATDEDSGKAQGKNRRPIWYRLAMVYLPLLLALLLLHQILESLIPLVYYQR